MSMKTFRFESLVRCSGCGAKLTLTPLLSGIQVVMEEKP